MYQKLLTPFRNFRFNRQIQKGPFQIEWYRYDLDENQEENIRGFSPDELKILQDYVVPNIANFGGSKNVLIVHEGELPVEELMDLVEDAKRTSPEFLIIKPQPKIKLGNAVSAFMEVELIDQFGKSLHNFNLPFGIVGRIIN